MRSRLLTPTLLRAWLLAALLLAAQAAGLAHRIAHAPGQGVAVAQAAWGQGHDAGTAGCRLVDQLAHADALCGAPGWAPAPAPRAAPVDIAAPTVIVARRIAAYEARAPPHG